MSKRSSIIAGVVSAFASLLFQGCNDRQANIETVSCGDWVCPAGTLCVPSTKGCADAAEIEACAGKQDEQSCETRSILAGICRDSVCVATGCGNGHLELGEVCDDGNQQSLDGCSALCDSDESCGNGIADILAGERCDCGDGTGELPAGCLLPNGNAEGALCRSDCRLHCGDGIKDAAEECDGEDLGGQNCGSVGFYQGTLSCNAFCRLETSQCEERCGDGVINGPELCDGEAPVERCVDFGFGMGATTCSSSCGIDLSRCVRFGWRQLRSSGGGYVSQLWRARSGELFASLFEGRLLRSTDGIHWSDLAVPENLGLTSVWGSSAQDVYTVGYADGAVFHFDGVSWTTLDVGTLENLYGVFGSGPNDVYVAGDFGTLIHFDGIAWAPVQGPLSGDFTGGWTDGDFLGVIDISGQIEWRRAGLWTVFDTGTGEFMTRMWGSGPTDVYTVSDAGNIYRFDGSAWSLVYQDLSISPPPSLVSVTGSAADDVWALGETVLHFDGSRWLHHPAPLPGIEYGLWSVARGRVMLSSGTGQFLQNSPAWIADWPITNPPSSIFDLWGTSNVDLFAVGSGGAILHDDGRGFVSMNSGVSADIRRVWGISSNEVYAVGKGGTVLRYDGTLWNPIDLGVTVDLLGIGGSSSSDLWIAGAQGTLFHFDGLAWAQVDLGTVETLLALDVAAVNEVYVLSGDNQLHTFNGATWTTEDLGVPTGINLFLDVWSQGGDLLLVGTDGLAARRVSGVWQSVDLGSSSTHYGIFGFSNQDIFVFGSDGSVLHDDGVRFSAIRWSGSSRDSIYAAWGEHPSQLIFGGNMVQNDTTRSADPLRILYRY